MHQPPPLPLGKVGARFGVSQRTIRNLFLRGILPEPGRVGAYRVVAEEDLPKVEQALRDGGYLRTAATEMAGTV